MAGLALTPVALQSIRPGLRILDKKDRMPKLPEVEFVLLGREKDTRPAVSALAGVIRGVCPFANPHAGSKWLRRNESPIRPTSA